jgi:hypothetical protein
VKPLPYLFAALLLIAYALPWAHTPTVGGFTNSAFDLAEWVSIHPSVRAESFLWTPFLLRLPLACIALYIAFCDSRRQTTWLRATAVILLAVALLPPLEYFTIASGDSNYAQMFWLALGTLVIAAIAMSFAWLRNVRIPTVVALIPLLIALVAGIAGLTRALPLIQGFAINAQIGAGAVAFAAIVAIYSVVTFAWKRNS